MSLANSSKIEFNCYKKKTYFSKFIASWSVEGKSTFPVSGSNKQSKPTDIFTMEKMIYGITGFTFLP